MNVLCSRRSPHKGGPSDAAHQDRVAIGLPMYRHHKGVRCGTRTHDPSRGRPFEPLSVTADIKEHPGQTSIRLTVTARHLSLFPLDRAGIAHSISCQGIDSRHN
jgi:hypothetical protein